MAFLRPFDKRNLEPRSSYIKSGVLSLNQVTFYFLLCCPPWHLIQDTLFLSHCLSALWWEDMPCLRRVLCMSAVPAMHPPFFFWVSAAHFEEEVVLMSEPGGVSKRTPAVREEAISQDTAWKLEHRQPPLRGKKKSKTEARHIIRTRNCALPYGPPGPAGISSPVIQECRHRRRSKLRLPEVT